MLDFYYNQSDKILQLLEKIDKHKATILLTPLSPRVELYLRWSTTLQRLYYAFVLQDPLLTRQNIEMLIVSKNKRKINSTENALLRYKKVLEYIQKEWLVSNSKITINHLEILGKLTLIGSEMTTKTSLQASEASINLDQIRVNQALAYIETQPHPVLQAATAYILLLKLEVFEQENKKIACLFALIYLYRAGYDLRGLTVLEKCWTGESMAFHLSMQWIKSANGTFLLESLLESLSGQLQKISESIVKYHNISIPSTTYGQLNDRQQSIIEQVIIPDSKISNKQVQNLFHVSQITASRDLSKLSNLGILYPHGKGRSVYYTKI